MNTIQYSPEDNVYHQNYGAGQVIIDNGDSVIVRFDAGIQECEKSSLSKRLTPQQAIHNTEWHRPLEVITKVQIGHAVLILFNGSPINCLSFAPTGQGHYK